VRARRWTFGTALMLWAAWPGGVQAQETDPHAGHRAADPAAPPVSDRRLFQSDMPLMAGMTARDPMAGMDQPGWQWMGLAVGRLGRNDQGGPSGEESFESSNWIMGMAQRRLGRGRLTLMAMGSLEPATVPEAGSPELFQVGETFQGRLIVDRQHAHDLFMNVSATYRRALGAEAAWWAQAALVGEPALGPTAFMHRASSGENPTAPLSHHWQDSTHITNNVLTVGAGWRGLALDVSAFHGQEPDERRWDVDGGRPDSLSTRLRLELPDRWSAQVSYGYMEEPEALEPGDLRRTTASLHYDARGEGPFAASFIWGRNREAHGTTDAYLLEGAWQLTAGDQLYVRAEQVKREPALLLSKGFHPELFGHAHATGPDEERQEVDVQAFTLGYFKHVATRPAISAGLGADLTLYRFPGFLAPTYGDMPVSTHVFLRVRWQAGQHAGHRGHRP
jgi:hypothetical protein